MATSWMLLVSSAIVLQFVVGLGLAIAGLAMTIGQSRMGQSETSWPLSRKVTMAGTILLVLASIEFIGVIVVVLWWAFNERFA